MPTYAYRWADGSVSVCSAKDKTEAAQMFDQIAGVSRKLVIRLKSKVFITLRPSINHWWELDREQPLGEWFCDELEERCFPIYAKLLHDYLVELGDKMPPARRTAITRKLKRALKMDVKETQRKMDETPVPPDIVSLFPQGLPGQNN